MNTTIKDVAKEANVSPSTVSRVLSGNAKISDETKAKVMEAVKKLNYHPNAIARSLAHSSTHILGLILPSEAQDFYKNPFFIQLMTGIGVYTQEKGYNIMYSFGKNEKEELSCIKRFINSRLVDGIILLTSRNNDKCISYLKERNYPFVVVGRPEAAENIMWVDNDNFEAMYSVVNKLAFKGHRDIAFISGPEDWNVSADRLDGYKRALNVHCLKIRKEWIVQQPDFSERYGYEAMKKILQAGRPTAVVTTDDLLAFGAMNAIKEETGDKKIAVVGFNNTALAGFQDPPLSSVEINSYELGFYAAKLLIRRLSNRDKGVSTHYIVKTDFIERESTMFKP
ncbi:LacI family DNA-binding transcriptional regulator [Clostridium thermarum]|uniref:LacI family DNA-binding transcriptional regulator n=1 Tax=Clostridium thermarum TaxID=1716543 RepID=UPI00112283B8|nr:LacI family DNA-binding transcriptional regulator [Clostridium thermarum]